MTKREGRILEDRVCASCSVNHGHVGPRPYGSAIRLVDGKLVYWCAECAQKENDCGKA